MLQELLEGYGKVVLTKEELDRARYFGEKRTASHKHLNDMNPTYRGIDFKVQGADQDTLGVMAEYGVIKYLGLDPRECDWHPFSPNKADWKKPDILGAIEVRRVTQVMNPLRVYEKDAKARVICVKTFILDNIVYVQGWKYAKDVWGNNFARGTSNVAYLLEPVETLPEALERHLGGEWA